MPKTDIDIVWKIIKEVRVGFVLTRDGGRFDARPLHAMPDRDESVIYFMTDRDNDVARQVSADPRVYLTFSDPGRNDYLTLEGEAHLREDRAKIKGLWTAFSEAYWDGPEDPRITLIAVRPEHAHYWKAPNAIVTTLELIAGTAMGKQPDLGREATTRM